MPTPSGASSAAFKTSVLPRTSRANAFSSRSSASMPATQKKEMVDFFHGYDLPVILADVAALVAGAKDEGDGVTRAFSLQ